jgi:hypothetical protein
VCFYFSFRRALDSASLQNLVPVLISRIIYIDPVSGEETDVSSVWELEACASSMHLDGDATTACNFGSLTGDFCSNAVVSVSYQVMHEKDAFGTIRNVSAEIRVTDVLYSSFEASTSNQAFAASFFDDAAAFTAASELQVQNR